jgi:hypothetical protein
MKLRLHEIEIGTGNVANTTEFFQSALGLNPLLKQNGLTVFDAGLQGLDFNISNHLSTGNVILSFLTDDLAAVQEQLTKAGISFRGPSSSHLGMTFIQFNSPEGLLINVNAAGPAPSRLDA